MLERPRCRCLLVCTLREIPSRSNGSGRDAFFCQLVVVYTVKSAKERMIYFFMIDRSGIVSQYGSAQGARIIISASHPG